MADMEGLPSNLSKEVTFIAGTRETRLSVSLLEERGIPLRNLIREADTLTPSIIIPLDNVSFGAFNKLERYLVNPRAPQPPLTSLTRVMDMVAIYRSCPTLQDVCLDYLYHHLTGQGASALVEAKDPELVKLATDYLSARRNANSEADSSLQLYQNDLSRFVDAFGHQPYQLFVMLVRKARVDSETTRVPVRSVINEFLPKIEFLSMTSEEFLTGPAQSDVLSEGEKLSILANIGHPGSLQLPHWCSTRRAGQEEIFCVNTCKYPDKYNELVKSPFTSVLSFSPENHDVVLVGLDFHTAVTAFQRDSYAPAILRITAGTRSRPVEFRLPFPPKSMYLEIPGGVFVRAWSTCHLSATVSEPGLTLFSCDHLSDPIATSNVRIRQNGFACSCNLTPVATHIRKIYLRKC